MQWDQSEHAGFSKGVPWLPLSDDYPAVNVKTEQPDPRSYLNLYLRLLALRRSHAALCVGAYLLISVSDDLLAYIRRAGSERMLVVLNLSDSPCTLDLNPSALQGRVLLSTHLDREGELVSAAVALRGNEGLIIAIADDGTGSPS